MTASMLHADANAVGNITSGGTESILCAVKAYRDRARQLYPHIKQPEMVSNYGHCYLTTEMIWLLHICNLNVYKILLCFQLLSI